MWMVIGVCAGIVLFFAWPTDPPRFVGGGVVLIAIAALVATQRREALRPWLVALAAIGFGHCAAEVRTDMAGTPVLTRTLPAAEIRGRVVDAENRPASYRVVLEKVTVPGLAAADTPVRVRISIPLKSGLPKVGDHIVMRAVLRPPMKPALPDGFEFQRQLYFAQIGATGFGFGAWHLEDAGAKDGWFDEVLVRIEAIRRHVSQRVTEAIKDPGDATTTAALIMGEQGAIPGDLQEAYRRSGLAHLLSISGVHMSLLAAVVFFLIRKGLALVPPVALRVDTKKIAAWVALAAVTLYVLISGLSVPAVRSFLMIGVVLVAILLDRTAISLRTIACAALVLMLIYPDAVVGASFQMSFMAVLALIGLAEQMRVRVTWRNADGELAPVRALAIIFLGLAITDIVASGSTALFAIYHFNRFPTYSMASNFVAGPITGLWVMPWGLVAMLLMPLGLDRIPLELMGMGVGWVNDIARTVAAWPGAQVHVPPMSAPALAIGAFGLAFACLWQGRVRWGGLLLVALAVTQPFLAKAPDVLLDEESKIVAVTDASGRLVLRPGRGGSFIRDVWKDRYGESAAKWTSVAGFTCDADGCILSRNGQRALLAFTPTALAEDCAKVDAAISFIPGRAFCRGTPVHDVFDVRRHGAVALRMSERGVTARYVDVGVGDRRWSPRAKPRPARTEREPSDPQDMPAGVEVPEDREP